MFDPQPHLSSRAGALVVATPRAEAWFARKNEFTLKLARVCSPKV
ncbi:MAG: hypothetical protein Q7J25_03840 [Vicinamibacterales bacterium]|nr:hypothetical protein [Vicinamibacterales bacterium]